jgi:L-threonylcarbamoyladenylate synthase
MSNTQAIVSAFKKGQLVFMHDKKGSYLTAATGQKAAIGRMLELVAPDALKEAFVAIGEAPQLYDYVVKIPDLAWEIVEYTEKPLHVIYKEGKGVPEVILQDGKIRLMLVLQNPLHDILLKLHQGILCMPVDPGIVEELKEDIAEALALAPQSGCQLTAERIMELGPEGEVKFLKK